jgi:ferrochelatase
VSNPSPSDAPKIGVLLVNLGTPDAPTAAAVRRYLAEFLWDPRVVEAPRWLWWLALHGVILRVRPARSAEAYAQIWTPDGSPLRVLSERLTACVEQALAEVGPVEVALAMRYGNPSIPERLRALRAAGVERLVVLPLYPQYSATTTASVLDAVGAELARWRLVPSLRFVRDYATDPAYVDALAARVAAHWQQHPRGDHLVMSFHGIPQRYVRAGDPYEAHCRATAKALAEQLGLAPGQWTLCFQSQVGREPWLEPYTDAALVGLAGAGVRAVDVVCPGFAVDCLETLEEIALRNRQTFLRAGGERYAYVPALNDEPAHVAALVALLRREAGGWLGKAPAPPAGAARPVRA